MQILYFRRVRCVSVLLLASAVLLPGCEASKLARTFGLSRDAPDEFTVTTRAPLSMPPEFALRPPRPGAPRPQEQSERNQAEEALAPRLALGQAQGGESAGQSALLQQAGPAAATDIRRQVDRDAQLANTNTGFVDRLLNHTGPTGTQTAVNAQKEAERIRQNAALGQSPTAGETVVIKEKKSSWLAGLFNWL
jgi:hypothetical protein